jgi:hypothetical protein
MGRFLKPKDGDIRRLQIAGKHRNLSELPQVKTSGFCVYAEWFTPDEAGRMSQVG